MAFCGKCGSVIIEGNPFCQSCGAVQNVPPQSGVSVALAAAAPAREKKFFEDQRVLVTNARCVMEGKTFAMNGITSVAAYTQVPSRKGPIILIVLGLIGLLGSLSSRDAAVGIIVSVLAIGLGILWYKNIKDIYHVVIHSASGEARPIHDYNSQYIGNIVQALNDAIVHRG